MAVFQALSAVDMGSEVFVGVNESFTTRTGTVITIAGAGFRREYYGTDLNLDTGIVTSASKFVNDVKVWTLQGTYITAASLSSSATGLSVRDWLASGDFVFGSAGNDTLLGYSGNDFIQGGLGNDVLNGDGQSGTNDLGDWVSYAEAPSAVVVNLLTGTATGGDGTDQLSNFENIMGSYDSDQIIGNGANNEVWAKEGNDTVDGGGGNDRLDGGADNDALSGGIGVDVLLGGLGDDVLDGGDGNDQLDGGIGADIMRGGAGNDLYFVNVSGDGAIESSSGGGVDTVYASINFTLGAYLENLVLQGGALTGTGNSLANKITGNAANNLLRGQAGNDVISAGAGNDKIYGGTGSDYLRGGTGKDVFIFNTAPNRLSNVDKIVDFKSVDDTIWLENAFLKAVGPNGRLAADAFHLGKAAADAEDRIVYDKASGSLYYDADGTGAHAQIRIAILTNKAALALSDLIVV